jgi:hypothetical protein
MLQLWRGARSGNGWLTLCALSRTLPLDESEKARSKRLYRLEESLLQLIAACLPPFCKPVYVMDRGYARASLLKLLRNLKIPFVLRGRCNTIVRLGRRRISLGRLPRRAGKARRYCNLAYQDSAQEPVDVVVFHDPRFKEPWFLLVPARSEDKLPTHDVVQLYRERMHIELTFRDWKTHLGVRGLRLEVDQAARLSRLLLALSVAYILVVLLGSGDSSECCVCGVSPKGQIPTYSTPKAWRGDAGGTGFPRAVEKR